MADESTPKTNKRNDQIVALFRSAFPGYTECAVAEMKRNTRITKDLVLASKTLVYVEASAEQPLQAKVFVPGAEVKTYFVPADSFRVLGK